VAELTLAQPRRLQVETPGPEPDPQVIEVEQVSGGGHGTVEVVGVDSRYLSRPGVGVDSDEWRGVDDVNGRRHADRAVGGVPLGRERYLRSQLA
jgi:hypothetical protein